MYDLVIRGERVFVDGVPGAHEVGVRAGRIEVIKVMGEGLTGRQVLQLSHEEVLLPGLVDTHVHVNEPGRTEWEGFASATRAAAAGGVTTILDMPLNSVPATTNAEALEVKRRAAAGQCFVDVGFWGGALPENIATLAPLHRAGVFGFKCFLVHSGVEEFPSLETDELEKHLREVAALGSVMIVHAEDATILGQAPPAHGSVYDGFLASRPPEAENRAIETVIDCARKTGARVHILHLSSAEALPLIRAAKDEGIRITVETCPHYLAITSEEIAEGATTFKCCPPIRDSDNRKGLWQGLKDGTIDFIVSDHSPSTIELKQPIGGDFGEAWGGIASLQLGLSVVWTEARQRGLALSDVTRWMSTRPADVFGVAGKGRIAVGNYADLVVFAPDVTYVVNPGQLHHKNPVTAYAGRELTGEVRKTILRGEIVDGEDALGEMLVRESNEVV